MTIRKMTIDDLEWTRALAAKAYTNGFYDPKDSEAWLVPMLQSTNHLMLRGDRAMMITQIAPLPFCRRVKAATLLPVASNGFGFRELCEMNKLAIEWAKEKGAREFYWSAITGVDLGPLAKRFGAQPCSPAYKLEL